MAEKNIRFTFRGVPLGSTILTEANIDARVIVTMLSSKSLLYL